jgi:hypothetical protein
MKSADIIKQLQTVLPTVTDLFSDSISITSLTRSGTTITAITATAHGRSTGDVVIVSGAKSPTAISSLTFLNGIATAITSTRHDLTEEFQDGVASDNPLVTVSGATEVEYNGANPLLTVPNRTSFTYTITGAPTSPATGTPFLLESFNAGYNGRHIITVTGPTTFTYETTETPGSPAQGTILANIGVRVSGAITVDSAEAAYTQMGTDELWAFVILGDVVANKDRNVLSDVTSMIEAGSDPRERVIMPFGVLIFTPATDEIAGMNARDDMEDVRAFLFKSLLKVKFTTGLQSETRYGVIYENDGFVKYNGAYYMHQFAFSTMTDIIAEDMVSPDLNVAFRDTDLVFLDDLGTVELTAKVNLDEET